MAMVKNISILLLITIIINGCIKEEKDLNLNYNEAIATSFNAATNDTRTSLRCRLSKSQEGLISDYEYDTLKSGDDVKILFISSDTTELDETETGFYNETTALIPGEKYKILVDHKDYPVITAEQTCPKTIKVEEVKFNLDTILHDSLYYSIEVVLDKQLDFGAFSIESVVDFFKPDSSGAAMRYNSVRIKEEFRGIYFITEVKAKKMEFAGKVKLPENVVNQIDLGNDSLKRRRVYTTVYSSNEDHYTYLRESQLAFSNANDIFAEPIVLETNMSNGMGYFSIVNTREQVFFPDQE